MIGHDTGARHQQRAVGKVVFPEQETCQLLVTAFQLREGSGSAKRLFPAS